MQVLASKVRKGQQVWLFGVLVEITKREKWNQRDVKIHYKNCGQGLPRRSGMQTAMASLEDSAFFRLTDLLELHQITS